MLGRFSPRKLPAPGALVPAVLSLIVAVTITSAFTESAVATERIASAAMLKLNGQVTVLKMTAPFDDAEAVRDVVASFPEVEQANVFAIWQVATQQPEVNALLKIAPLSEPILRRKLAAMLVRGELPSEQPPDEPVQIAVGEDLAKQLDARPGTWIRLTPAPGSGATTWHATDCIVVGLIRSGYASYDGQIVLADISQMARIGLLTTGVEAWLGPGGDESKVSTNLRSNLGQEHSVLPIDELHRPAILSWRGRTLLARGLQLAIVPLIVMLCGFGLAAAGPHVWLAWSAVSVLAGLFGAHAFVAFAYPNDTISIPWKAGQQWGALGVVGSWAFEALVAGWVGWLGIAALRNRWGARGRGQRVFRAAGRFFEYAVVGVVPGLLMIRGSITAAFEASHLEGLRDLDGDVVVRPMISHELVWGTLEPALQRVPGVRATCRRVRGNAWTADGSAVRVEGLELACARAVKPFLPDDFHLAPGRAWVGAETKRPGDPPTIVLSAMGKRGLERTRSFEMNGAFRSNFYLYDSTGMILSQADARELLEPFGREELLVRTDGREETADEVEMAVGKAYSFVRAIDVFRRVTAAEATAFRWYAWLIAMAIGCAVAVQVYRLASEVSGRAERRRVVISWTARRAIAAVLAGIALVWPGLRLAAMFFQDSSVFYAGGVDLHLEAVTLAGVAVATCAFAAVIALPAALVPSKR